MVDGKKRIDRLRGAGGGLDREAVRTILPYGDDFLFVDRVARLMDPSRTGTRHPGTGRGRA